MASNEDREKGVSDVKRGGQFRTFVLTQSVSLKKYTFSKGADFLNIQIPSQFLHPQTDLEYYTKWFGVLNNFLKEFLMVKDDPVK